MALHFLRLSLEVGSAICGAANMMDVLIFGRVLAGTGGVGLYAGVMSMLSVTTTLKERPLYIGFTGLVWGCGAVTGQLSPYPTFCPSIRKQGLRLTTDIVPLLEVH